MIAPAWKKILFLLALAYTAIPLAYVDIVYLGFAMPYFVGEAQSLPLYWHHHGQGQTGLFLWLLICNAVITILLLTLQLIAITLLARASRRRRFRQAFLWLMVLAGTGFLTLGALVLSNMNIYKLF